MRLFYLLLAFFCSSGGLHAQESDTLRVDSAAVVIATEFDTSVEKTAKKWWSRDYPNPKKALILGLALPGAGQIYNKRWWKLPLVYGGLVGMGFVIDYNQTNYRRLRNALELKRAGERHEWSNTRLDDDNTLRRLRDEFDKNTQLAYVGFILIYVLQGMEAFVDSHLKTFDIEDDIGFRIKPSMEYNVAFGTPTLGLGITVPLNRQRRGGFQGHAAFAR